MSVSGVGSTSGSSTTPSSATSALTANYSTFLTLLTSQLKTQNPLDPMDVNSFTQQLVQYSAVEQQIQTNSKLTAMMETLTSSAALQLVNYVGKSVTAYSDTTKFADGAANWTVNSSAEATGAAVTVTDANGAIVYHGTTDLKKGSNKYTWDGKGSDGNDYSTVGGAYKIAIAGVDANGKAVTITTEVTGKVQSIDTSGAQPYIKVNDTLVPLSALTAVST